MKTLVITPGDPNGIGPEVTAKALHRLNQKLKPYNILIFGSKKSFKPFECLIRKKNIQLMEMPPSADPGFLAGWSIEQATKLVLRSPKDHVLITGPINKMRLNAGGFKFQGHTDFLGSLCNTKNPTMMLMNETLRIALVTQHCSIKSVPKLLTKASILKVIEDTSEFLINTLKIKNPKIAVLGLNPHAGEDGLIGSEELKIIIPTIEIARHKKLKITGPHPADSFFSIELKKKKKDRHDAIIAMYHDQGLIPLKLMGFHRSINITLGLPIIRTSVDHGTAFDIAGKNKANSESMELAIESAIEFLGRNKK